MTDVPIHNWEDADYYNNLKNEKDLSRWAWEFLRRNPEYRADYKRFSSFPDCDDSGNNKIGKWRGLIWQGARFYVDAFHYTKPPANIGETLEEYENRCPSGEIIPYAWYMESKYHIDRNPQDPLKEFQEVCINFHDMNESVWGYEFPPWEIDVFPDYECFANTQFFEEYNQSYLERMKIYGRKQSAVILAFDVRQPIDEQLDMAKQLLLERKKSYKNILNDGFEDDPLIKKPSIVRKFSIYIRILDALCSGAKEPEIRRVLYPTDKKTDTNAIRSKLKSNIKSSIRWRDYDYWKLAV